MENQDAFNAWYDNEVHSGRNPGRCPVPCYTVRSAQPEHIEALEEIIRSSVVRILEDAAKWVSVKDRLPSRITNKVIVCCKNGYVGFGHYEDYKGVQTWFNLESGKPFSEWAHDEPDDYDVTHWMPLPEPPK